MHFLVVQIKLSKNEQNHFKEYVLWYFLVKKNNIYLYQLWNNY